MDPSEEAALQLAMYDLLKDGKSQKEVASHLGIGEPKLTRLKQEAEKSGLRRTYIWEAAPRDEVIVARAEQLLRGADKQAELVKTLKKYCEKEGRDESHVPKVTVRLCDEEYVEDRVTGTFVRSQESTAEAAAMWFTEHLQDLGSVGLTWGWTISNFVDAAIRRSLRSTDKRTPVRVIPLCGDPIAASQGVSPHLSASILAWRLVSSLGGTERSDFSLQGVAHWLSITESPDVLKFFQRLPSYQRVRKEPIDTLVTSCGGTSSLSQQDEYQGVRFTDGKEWCAESDVPWNSAMLAGDIAGWFLVSSEHEDSRKYALQKRLNERWLGPKLADLEDVARRAMSSDKKSHRGVVVIANGEEKASVLQEALTGPKVCINHLFLDSKAADALEARIAQKI